MHYKHQEKTKLLYFPILLFHCTKWHVSYTCTVKYGHDCFYSATVNKTETCWTNDCFAVGCDNMFGKSRIYN